MSKERQVGQLKVTIVAGRNLASKDRNGLSDPYVKLYFLDAEGNKIKETRKKTDCKKKTLNPTWDNSSFVLPITQSAIKLRIQCWDKDTIGSDFMGEISLPLPTIIQGGPRDEWIKLGQRSKGAKKDEVVTGDLHLKIEAETFDSAENQKVEALTVLNKLFHQDLKIPDISFVLPCSMVEKKGPVIGSLVASKQFLFFYSDSVNHRRKAKEILWQEIVEMKYSQTDGGLKIFIGAPKTTQYDFEDIVDNDKQTVESIIQFWDKASKVTVPEVTRRRRLSRKLTSKKRVKGTESADASADHSELNDELTEYSEFADGSDEEALDNVAFRSGLKDAQPVKNKSSSGSLNTLPLSENGSILLQAGGSPTFAHLKLKYVPGSPKGNLFVQVVNCENLPSKTKRPAVFVELMLDAQTKQTTVENTLFPVFQDQKFSFEGSENGQLVVSAWCQDSGKDVFLAEGVVTMSDLDPNQTQDLQVELKPRRRQSRKSTTLPNPSSLKSSSSIKESATGIPVLTHSQSSVTLNISYDSSVPKLNLLVVKASLLPMNNSQDSSVRVSLGEKQLVTEVIHSNSNPRFDKSFNLPITKSETSLSVTVWNEKTNSPIGETVLRIPPLESQIGVHTFTLKPVAKEVQLRALQPEKDQAANSNLSNSRQVAAAASPAAGAKSNNMMIYVSAAVVVLLLILYFLLF